MKRRHLLLPILPLLLMVPLGVFKWRADHPPESQMDKDLRVAFGHASSVRIHFVGQSWHQFTGLPSGDHTLRTLVVKDKQTVSELVGTLHCTDQAPPASFSSEGTANLVMDFTWPPSGQMKWNSLFYVQNPQGRFLQLYYLSPTAKSRRRDKAKRTQFVRVQSRFAPRFEALLAGLARRAQAPGTHPDVTLQWEEF